MALDASCDGAVAGSRAAVGSGPVVPAGPVVGAGLVVGSGAVGGAERPPSLLHQPHPTLAAQRAFADDCARVLRLAEASGHRLVTALYLVLTRHEAVPSTVDHQLHLTCAECRPEGREPARQYPCPTAQQAYWALDAILR
jgi:hypothetical protein